MRTPLRRYLRGANLVTLHEVQSGARRVYHFDHQGTTQCLTTGGAVSDRFASDAWGVQVKRIGTSANTTWFGGNKGYETRSNGEMAYVRGRYLRFARGVWLSGDRVSEFLRHLMQASPSVYRRYLRLLMDIANGLPPSSGAYTYVTNRPSALMDPTGWMEEAPRCGCDPKNLPSCEEICAAAEASDKSEPILRKPFSCGGVYCRCGVKCACRTTCNVSNQTNRPGRCKAFDDCVRKHEECHLDDLLDCDKSDDALSRPMPRPRPGLGPEEREAARECPVRCYMDIACLVDALTKDRDTTCQLWIKSQIKNQMDYLRKNCRDLLPEGDPCINNQTPRCK